MPVRPSRFAARLRGGLGRVSVPHEGRGSDGLPRLWTHYGGAQMWVEAGLTWAR